MKRTKTLLLALLCTVLYALPAVADDVAKTVELTEAGTLSTTLTDEEKSTITHLTITGKINKLDFDVMKSYMPSLTYIDLSGSTIAAYSSYPANTIPESALGHSSSGYGANTKISTFIFPKEVTSIDFYAFYFCTGLTGSLAIPEGVTYVGGAAFFGCIGLTGSLTIPEVVTDIGPYAFYYCSGFTGSLTIPMNVTDIGSYAFYSCTSIDNIIDENTIPCTLGDGAFPSNKVIFVPSGSLAAYKADDTWSSYKLLEEDVEVTIHLDTPNTLALNVLSAGYHPTTITKLTLSGEVGDDDWALLKSNFTSLYYLDMSGTTATAIPASAFYGNTLLQTFIFPENVETIGSSAFYDCTGFFGSLAIPEGITDIGSYAFYKCSNFNGSLAIPKGVTNIGSHAFYGCSGFTGSLTIPEGVACIDFYAFGSCSGFTGSLTISEGAKIGSHAFYKCSGFTGSLTISEGVSYIGENAFYGCSGFTGSLTIPKGIISLGWLHL